MTYLHIDLKKPFEVDNDCLSNVCLLKAKFIQICLNDWKYGNISKCIVEPLPLNKKIVFGFKKNLFACPEIILNIIHLMFSVFKMLFIVSYHRRIYISRHHSLL